MRTFRWPFIVAIILFIAGVASAQTSPPLRLVTTISLPDLKEGDFDHFAVDLAGNRLFLTAEANNAVVVLDTGENKVIHTIPDLEEPHSMLFLPAAKQLWVIAGGAAKIFNSDTYALSDTVKLTEGADASAYDPVKHLLYVTAGGSDAKNFAMRWAASGASPSFLNISSAWESCKLKPSTSNSARLFT